MRFINANLAVLLTLSLGVACAGQGTANDQSQLEASEPVVTQVEAVADLPATATTVPATETSAPPQPTDMPPLEEPTMAPIAEPTEVVVDEDLSGNECLDCHRDKERLIETANPEEEAPPSESSGVG